MSLHYAVLPPNAKKSYTLDVSLHSISNKYQFIPQIYMKTLCHWMLSNSRVAMNRITIWTPRATTATVPIRPSCCSTQREIAPRHPPRKITLCAVNSSNA